MADLSAMYRATAESVPQPDEMMLGGLGMQRIMSNGLQYQQERDNYEAMRGLRALFAQNPEPSISDIGALSPEFAQKYMMNNLAMREKALGIRKTEGEIGRIRSQKLEQDAKFWAPLIGPVAEAHINDPDPSALRAELGQVIKHGQDMGLDIDPSFDINAVTPLQLLQIAASRGYKSQYLEAQGAAEKERAIAGVPPRMQPEEVRPQPKFIPETGQTVLQPAPYGGGAQPGPEAWQQGKPAPRINGHIQPHPRALRGRGGAQEPDAATVASLENMTDVNELKQIFKQLPNGSPDKVAVGRRINELMEQQYDNDVGDNEPGERFASSGEIQRARVKVAGDKAAAEAQGKADVERKEGAENKLTVLESIPPVEKIDALIDQSISSGLEARVKNITSGEFGLEDDAVTATESLKTIEGQFKKLTRELAGAGAFSDSEQKMIKDATADVANPRVPVEARKAKMRFVMNMMENAVKKYPDLAQRLKSAQGGGGQHTPRAQALIDAHKAKTISDEQFAKEWDALPDEEY